LELVRAWLEEHEIVDYTHNPSKDWIHIVVPIEKAESLLQTKYSSFKNWAGSTISRAPEWSLPRHLHEHIDVVQPTNSFFRASPDVSMPLLGDTAATEAWWEQSGAATYVEDDSEVSISKLCNVSFTTVRCLRALYGTLGYEVQSKDKNGIGIVSSPLRFPIRNLVFAYVVTRRTT
jgi:tripeptidyl-peptidase I